MSKKTQIILFQIFSFIINDSSAQFSNNPYGIFLQTSLVAEAQVQTNRNCFCVPYWQCKEDFTGFVDDGVDIIDIRVVNDDDHFVEQLETVTGDCTGDFDVCCRIQCGKLGTFGDNNENMDAAFNSRIVGPDAKTAHFGEFPWMLGILQNKAYKCGASLIHPKVAITAAHCVFEGGRFKVRAGEHNWASHNEPIPHQDRFTEKIIIYPRYHAPSLSNDIALLILDKEFKLGENVGIVCLPTVYQPQLQHAKNCIASGWGKNSYSNGVYQTTLKKVELPVIPRQVCLESLRRARLGPYFNLHASFMCAGGRQNRDTCKGDGGSPLVCPTSTADHYEQIGIVSWGLTCGLKNTPGVYVNVAMFLEWIDEQLEALNFDTLVYKY